MNQMTNKEKLKEVEEVLPMIRYMILNNDNEIALDLTDKLLNNIN